MAYDLFKDVIKSLNEKTGNLFDEDFDTANAAYNPFIVNLCFSYGADSLLFANEMNARPWMSNRQQYDFYYYGLPKAKRFNKWVKAEEINNFEVISEYYQCSDKKAKEYLDVLSEEKIEKIKTLMFKGDISNERKSNKSGKSSK